MDDIDLGPCCACNRRSLSVRNVVSLPYRAPLAGTGWGCLVCNLPPDGALAVLCDRCLRENRTIVRYCVGYAAASLRAPIPEHPEPFDHDEAMHEGE